MAPAPHRWRGTELTSPSANRRSTCHGLPRGRSSLPACAPHAPRWTRSRPPHLALLLIGPRLNMLMVSTARCTERRRWLAPPPAFPPRRRPTPLVNAPRSPPQPATRRAAPPPPRGASARRGRALDGGSRASSFRRPCRPSLSRRAALAARCPAPPRRPTAAAAVLPIPHGGLRES